MAKRRTYDKQQGFERVASAKLQNTYANNNEALRALQQKIEEQAHQLELIEKQRKQIEAEEARLREEQENSPYTKFAKYTKYWNKPVEFAEDVLGVTLTEQQIEVVEALLEPPHQVFVAASHAIGKSHLAAVLSLYFALCMPDSIVITLAPTFQQVQDILWRNIRAMNPEPLLFKGTTHKPQFHITQTWFGKGVSPASPDALQGLHASSTFMDAETGEITGGYQLIILDEAVGIDENIFRAVEALNNEHVYILAICNPTSIDSEAYQQWLSGKYKTIRLSGMDHPNIKAYLEGKPIPFPGAITYEHYLSKLKEWSQEVDPRFIQDGDVEFPPGSGEWYRPSAEAQSRLLGLWPTDTGDSFFTPHLVDVFLREIFIDNKIHNIRYTDNASYEYDCDIQCGLDVARLGDDQSVIAARYKNEIVKIYRLGKVDLTGLYEAAIEVLRELGIIYNIDPRDININVDITGLGSGIYDLLVSQNYLATDIHFSQRPNNPQRYANTRTELYGDLVEKIKQGSIYVADELRDDYGSVIRSQMLRGASYKYDSRGRFILEPKDRIRKILGQSPDELDAIALACYPTASRISVITA